MIAATALLLYAMAAGTFGGSWLRRAIWPERSPRLAIAMWQVLTTSLVLSAVLAGLTLAVPGGPMGGNLANLLHTCVMLVRQQYSTPGGATAATLGVLFAASIVARLAFCLSGSLWSARRGRSRQRAHLALVARRDDVHGALVVDHGRCAAYCVPGGAGRVVVTSAAMAALDDEQLAAVLAHERAHLRGRHHLAVQAASALRSGFPFVPAFAAGAAEIARLTEMLADDASCRSSDRLTLATALVRLAEVPAPAGALGAGGSTAIARVRRLADPAPALPWAARLAGTAAVFVVAATPLLIASAPALAVVSAPYCPISMAS